MRYNQKHLDNIRWSLNASLSSFTTTLLLRLETNPSGWPYQHRRSFPAKRLYLLKKNYCGGQLESCHPVDNNEPWNPSPTQINDLLLVNNTLQHFTTLGFRPMNTYALFPAFVEGLPASRTSGRRALTGRLSRIIANSSRRVWCLYWSRISGTFVYRQTK